MEPEKNLKIRFRNKDKILNKMELRTLNIRFSVKVDFKLCYFQTQEIF